MKSSELAALEGRTIAILGYGNQGRAQALNLRDSGMSVIVGSRSGKSASTAGADGFKVLDCLTATLAADIILFLLPDHVIPQVYGQLENSLEGKSIGFSHGFAMQFGKIHIWESSHYFLVSPKGAGVFLRKNFEEKKYLPGVFAIGPTALPDQTRALARAYAAAIGVSQVYLKETNFQEETECDLFGEQVVLCGGIPELIENAFRILVENGHDPEMAFLETCYEAKLIIDLLLKLGPAGLANRISPTAFFGGKIVGKRLVDHRLKDEMKIVFDEIRSGQFAARWFEEAEKGMPRFERWKSEIKESSLQKTY